ncbi:MAG: hypothetical protein J0L87_03720 [Bacteroidetes bacterium]|nr:hypothetical protein [Bacteroidota bacterium]
MNRICLILALTGVLMQNFGKVFILLNFELNRDYIAKSLCVKKDIPNNSCKGKCHLKKELDKEEKKEQSPANPIKEKEVIQFFSEFNSGIRLFNPSITNELTSIYFFSLSEKHLHSIFHPPQSC